MSDKIRELLNRIVPRLDAGGPNPIDPALHHCEWVLYRERERIHAEFDAALSQQPATTVPEEQSLDARLEAAGMLTVVQLMQGQPIDAFIKHAGVHDLATFPEWLDLKCREFLSMTARRELEKQEDDELYEWVFAHAAVFHEVRVNFKAATAAPAAPVAQEPHTFWVLFDATAEQRFIKKMLPEGFLAFFDCERDARLAKARNPGTDYKRIDYYTAPPAAEQPDTVAVPRAVLADMAQAVLLDQQLLANRLRALLAGGDA